MKRFTIASIVAALALSASAALLIAAARPTPAGATPVYSVATAYRGLTHDPAAWEGRVVRVRGVVKVASAPWGMPVIAVLNDPPEHVMVGAVDLLGVGPIRWLLGRDDEGGTPGLFFHEAPSSHQRLDMRSAAIYRVRLTRVPFGGQSYAVATAV